MVRSIWRSSAFLLALVLLPAAAYAQAALRRRQGRVGRRVARRERGSRESVLIEKVRSVVSDATEPAGLSICDRAPTR